MVPRETGREGLVSQPGPETRLSLGQSELSEVTPWTHRELVLAFKGNEGRSSLDWFWDQRPMISAGSSLGSLRRRRGTGFLLGSHASLIWQ